MKIQNGIKILNMAHRTSPFTEDDDYHLALEQRCPKHLKERKIGYICISKDQQIAYYYTMFKVIGRGTYGVVYAVRENQNKSTWAIKILTKKEGKISNSFHQEIEILKFVDHPNIIKLNCIVESPTSVYLVIELCDGVLSDLFKLQKVLSEHVTRGIIKELANAVAYLHNNAIVHRDIKMQNILWVKDDSVINENKFTIKLTDFGLSSVNLGATFQDNMMHERCGTLAYMAPEIIIKRSYSQQCDIWAIGVLLYTLLSGELPFARPTEIDIKEAITTKSPDFDRIRVDCINKDCVVHLIQRLLTKDPARRSTAVEILDHPWILKQPLQELKNANVLDMMAQWRDDLNIRTLSIASQAHDGSVFTQTPRHSVHMSSVVCEKLPKRASVSGNKQCALSGQKEIEVYNEVQTKELDGKSMLTPTNSSTVGKQLSKAPTISLNKQDNKKQKTKTANKAGAKEKTLSTPTKKKSI